VGSLNGTDVTGQRSSSAPFRRDEVDRQVPWVYSHCGCRTSAGGAAFDGSSCSRAHAAAAATIGEVLTQLRPEFSAITISKTPLSREAKSLVTLRRTQSGYRKFRPMTSPGCVRCYPAARKYCRRVIKIARRSATGGLVPTGDGGCRARLI